MTIKPCSLPISLKLVMAALAISCEASAEPYLDEPLWGDTHVHTSYSFDAYLNGNLSADPDTAYRWARGEPVIHPYTQARVQIQRPLDFLVVADHAEFMGVIKGINEDKVELQPLPFGASLKRWLLVNVLKYKVANGSGHDIESDNQPPAARFPEGDPVSDPNNEPVPQLFGDTEAIEQNAWAEIVAAADRHNQAKNFTAFIGWEWSSTPSGSNLHRVVITPNGAEKANRFNPFGSDQSQYPQDLWRWLDKTKAETEADFLAIPHNPNISNGFMFPAKRLNGGEITADYARTRSRWEPVMEVTQFKGDSETHPLLSPSDPFADFERYNFVIQRGADDSSYQAKPGSFARSAFKTGLQLQQKISVNPYKLGMIGSSDSHTGLSSTEENNFHGKMVRDSIPANKRHTNIDGRVSGWSMAAQGLAAVWAQDNSRQAIFDAFKRREVYATTGPRIKLRFFAAWDFPGFDPQAKNLAQLGYRYGVPMGGDLYLAEPASNTAGEQGNRVPKFLVQAVRDAQGANLDRVQMVKGWLDDQGRSHEKIFNIAWSDQRQLASNGELPALQPTVNTKTGQLDNSIGSEEFYFQWQDPEFNPKQSAFYYLRVLEIPSLRHSVFDTLALSEPHPPSLAKLIQERAYSSPIWYTPIAPGR